MAKTTKKTRAAVPKDIHVMTIRVPAERYRRLRQFAIKQEQKSGERITHQAIMDTALVEYLDRNGGD
jgi:hypothetical protein